LKFEDSANECGVLCEESGEKVEEIFLKEDLMSNGRNHLEMELGKKRELGESESGEKRLFQRGGSQKEHEF